MKRSLLLLALCVIVAPAALAQDESKTAPAERIRVATVGQRTIYLDEIRIEGDIPGVQIEDEPQKRKLEIATLRQRIRQAIIGQEIAVRNIKAPEAVVKQKEAAMAEQAWKALGPTEEAREKALEKFRHKMTKIYEALVIWKDDKQRGDVFAKRELEPLGITQSHWRSLASQSDNPEVWKRIENARAIDREAFFHPDPSELLRGRRMVQLEQLKDAVIPDVSVSDTEARRLFDLTEGTEWIDLIVVTNRREALERIRERLKKEGPDALDGGVHYSRSRLSSSDLALNELNIQYRHYPFLLAIHCESIVSGTPSAVFEWISPDGRSNWLLYVAERKGKQDVAEPQPEAEAKLKKAIEDFKREHEFNLWLWTKMAEKTVIHLPEFQAALKGRD